MQNECGHWRDEKSANTANECEMEHRDHKCKVFKSLATHFKHSFKNSKN